MYIRIDLKNIYVVYKYVQAEYTANVSVLSVHQGDGLWIETVLCGPYQRERVRTESDTDIYLCAISELLLI